MASPRSGNGAEPATRSNSLTVPPSGVGAASAASFAEDRVRQSPALLAKVLSDEDPEGVHDLRVWSRRMQEILDVLYFESPPGSVVKIRRRLRRIRRRVGGWRDCDIALGLVRLRRRATRSARKRNAWDLVAAQLTRKRLDEILRARRWLLRRAVAALPASLEEAVIEAAGTASDDTLRRAIRVRITEAWEAWRAALAEADADRELASIHALRIAGKRLRYRIEVLHELGDKPLQSTLTWLRKAQDLLGDWHDRQTFYRLTAEVLGRPEVLLAEPDAVRVVVTDLETQRRKDFTALNEIFGLAKREAEQRTLDGWTAGTAGAQS